VPALVSLVHPVLLASQVLQEPVPLVSLAPPGLRLRAGFVEPAGSQLHFQTRVPR
jgi:hypothetical protein